MAEKTHWRFACMLASIFCWSFAGSVSDVAMADTIVFLGNSITQHGPDASIEWSGNWGMAASRADLDYVSQVTRLLRLSTHPRLTATVVSDYTLEHEFFQLSPERVEDLIAAVTPANIVVLQFGDNVDLANDRSNGMEFGDQYAVLLSGIRAHFGATPHLICIGKWWPSIPVDTQIAAKCQAAGGSFVAISDIHAELWGQASTERHFKSSGVGQHPSDRAMKEIADRVAGSVGR